ncbi:MAG TPA: hypothetical protein DD730_11445 [Desulfosporosinus sp.]|jgi:hypothetical protein|nr:hypothetical protein [Desulfosporosinus sp.]
MSNKEKNQTEQVKDGLSGGTTHGAYSCPSWSGFWNSLKGKLLLTSLISKLIGGIIIFELKGLIREIEHLRSKIIYRTQSPNKGKLLLTEEWFYIPEKRWKIWCQIFRFFPSILL